jgi:ParB-like chromosome segregation protein Spo0J
MSLPSSIKHNGLIPPLTVSPSNQGFEIATGARRFRAAEFAELFPFPPVLSRLRMRRRSNPG